MRKGNTVGDEVLIATYNRNLRTFFTRLYPDGGDNDTIFVDYDATSVGILNDILIDHIKEIGTIDESTVSGGRLVAV